MVTFYPIASPHSRNLGVAVAFFYLKLLPVALWKSFLKERRNESFRLEFQKLKLSSGLMSPWPQWLTKHIQIEGDSAGGMLAGSRR